MLAQLLALSAMAADLPSPWPTTELISRVAAAVATSSPLAVPCADPPRPLPRPHPAADKHRGVFYFTSPCR